jgi:hypothetical protein
MRFSQYRKIKDGMAVPAHRGRAGLAWQVGTEWGWTEEPLELFLELEHAFSAATS